MNIGRMTLEDFKRHMMGMARGDLIPSPDDVRLWSDLGDDEFEQARARAEMCARQIARYTDDLTDVEKIAARLMVQMYVGRREA
jgi:hypothetical protein